MHQIFLMLLLALLKFLILPAVVFAAPGPDDMVEGCRNCGPAIAQSQPANPAARARTAPGRECRRN